LFSDYIDRRPWKKEQSLASSINFSWTEFFPLVGWAPVAPKRRGLFLFAYVVAAAGPAQAAGVTVGGKSTSDLLF
jgi:hypothetical protein